MIMWYIHDDFKTDLKDLNFSDEDKNIWKRWKKTKWNININVWILRLSYIANRMQLRAFGVMPEIRTTVAYDHYFIMIAAII